MLCYACGKPIAPERLRAIPDATHCVSCLLAKGDVLRKFGRNVYDQKTGGYTEVVSKESREKADEAERAIADRVSRL